MENSAPMDRISNLPDELLCHILSFLPTKFAFKTSVLSKRWTPLCKLLTSLIFDDKSVYGEHALLHFCRLVNKVMLSHKLIKKLHLKCGSVHWNSLKFHHWIENAKQRPLENLHVSSNLQLIISGQSIFIFPTLVVLKLSMIKVDDNISVDLPSLKTLYLDHVHFKNKENFGKLLSGCPVLEDLCTRIHYAEEDNGVSTGGFETLSKLIKANIRAFDVPFKAIHKVQFLTVVVMDVELHRTAVKYC